MKQGMGTAGPEMNAREVEVSESHGNGLVCTCISHQRDGSDCEHILAELERLMASGEGFRIMDRSKFNQCKFCKSGDVVKRGLRRTKAGNVQLFKCRECGKKFTANPGFEQMRNNPIVITRSLQMYFTGMSFRDIANQLEMEGIKVSHTTIANWITKYSRLVVPYLDGIIPNVGKWFRADELWIKVAGKIAYLFASMDDETRYWLASEVAPNKHKHNADTLLRMTKQQAGKTPSVFITDKLHAYEKSARKIFGGRTYHKANAGIRSRRKNRMGVEIGANYHPSNNKMERLNGEIRDREKVFRGLKRVDTEILNGYRVYYNFTKKHGSLKGKTPAEAAGIKVEGPNKWLTIIQNAALQDLTA